jgi:hypothetical protein
MSEIKTLQEELSRYKKLTVQAQQVLQSIIDHVSQRTSNTNEKNREIFGDALKPSTLFDGLNEEYLEFIDNLNSIRTSLKSSLLKIVNFSHDTSVMSAVDKNHFQSTIESMKQQALLQENVFSCVEDLNSQNYDSDAMVTLLACVRYAPYFDVNSLDNLVLR